MMDAFDRVYTIEKIVHNGKGLARDDDGVVFIARVLPGEEVKLNLVPGRARTRIGLVTEIIKPSPDRVIPPCPLFGQCGGCDFQHASYPAQLAFKRAVLAEDLQRLAGLTASPDEVRPSPRTFHYRSRVRLHVQRGRAGFFGEDKTGFYPADRCDLAAEEINAAWADLPLLLKRSKPAREVELVATDDGGCLAVLDPGPDGKIFTRVVASAGIEWRPSPRARVAFRQVNPLQNETLRALVGKAVKELAPASIIELFAGAGNLTQIVAPHCARIVAVDSDPVALAIARELLPGPDAARVSLVAMDAADYIAGVTDPPDLVILDPPRAGARSAITQLVRLSPGAIVYVSCDSATLARDLKPLLAAGYRLHHLTPLDMFPQTAHLECVAVLNKN